MPCKDCTDRHVGCHSSCESYKKESLERKEINRRKRKELKINYALIGMGYVRCESLKKDMTGIR